MPNEDRIIPRSASKEPSKPSAEVGLRVSLIPVEKKKKIDPRAGFRKFIVICVAGLLLFLGVAGYLGYRYYSALDEIRVLDAQTAEFQAKSESLGVSLANAKATQNRLRGISALLADRRSFSPLFDFLEKHTVADVALSGVSVSEAGAVSLMADAATFEAFAAQLDEIKAQSQVKSAGSSGLNIKYDDHGRLAAVGFTMNIVFDPAFFKPAAGK